MDVFYPDPYKLTIYQDAIDEAKSVADDPISPYFIKNWVERYNDLGKELKTYLPPLRGIFNSRHCNFHELYNYFSELLSYLDISDQCELAFQEYSKIIAQDYEVWDYLFKGWVARFEHLGLHELWVAPLIDGDADVVKTIGGTHYVVRAEHFSDLVQFNDVFTLIYWEQEIRP